MSPPARTFAGAADQRLGRVADMLPNDPEFASDEVAIVADWCAPSGIAYGGRADIGHDAREPGRSVRSGSADVSPL